jgi:Domain of unknown function (DUF4873)
VTYDVIVVGADLPGFPTLGGVVTRSVFDDDTDTWTLTTSDGQICRSRAVISGISPFVPWIPDAFAHSDFRGVSFHATAPPADFDAAGRRIAVIGGDASSGQLISRLTGLGASVKVFPLPPRRVVLRTRSAKRYLRRQPHVVASPVEAVTASGICTTDGVRHEVDTIVYGTGFAVRDERTALVGRGGLTLRQAWQDGMEPYLGVAVHGLPNYFLLGGTDFEAAARYIVECLQLMNGQTRIEVRRSSQQLFNERVHLQTPSPRLTASAFDLPVYPGLHDGIYDGPATLTLAEVDRQVRVRLTGYIDAIDGQYHWQGTVFDRLPEHLLIQTRAMTLTVGQRSASARITETTPQGTHSIAGVGAPPFAPANVELTVPR